MSCATMESKADSQAVASMSRRCLSDRQPVDRATSRSGAHKDANVGSQIEAREDAHGVL